MCLLVCEASPFPLPLSLSCESGLCARRELESFEGKLMCKMPTYHKPACNEHLLINYNHAQMSHSRARIDISSSSPGGARISASSTAAAPPPPAIRAFFAAAPSFSTSTDCCKTAPYTLSAIAEMRFLPPHRRASSATACSMQPRCPNIAAANQPAIGVSL